MCEQLYLRALTHWGHAAQISHTMEGCGKLIAVLNRVFFRSCGMVSEVASEIAEMEIMCAQLRLVVGSALVDLEKVEKLAKLQALLRAEEV